MDTKITKRNFYNALVNLVETGTLAFETEDGMVEITGDQLVEFAQNEIAALDTKSEKARERAAKKRAENDAMTELVYAAVTAEYRTIADIAADVDSPDASRAVVQNRLARLHNEGRVQKTTVDAPLVEGGKARKVVAYALAE